MQPRYVRLNYGIKLRKLYANQFYLSPLDRRELLTMCEHGLITKDRDAVSFVDQQGEWLDG